MSEDMVSASQDWTDSAYNAESPYSAKVKRRKQSLEITVHGPGDEKVLVKISYGRRNGLVGVLVADPHELVELDVVR